MATTKSKHILLTGFPGVGKTTIVRKVCYGLKEKNIPVTGFYTEEVRTGNKRIGFDVVTLDGQRGRLARSMGTVKDYKYKIGNYTVFLDEFEKIVLPLFEQINNSVFVIDEIGKMELFSQLFKKNVTEAFNKSNIILATIPVQKGKPILLVEDLRQRFSSGVIMVDRINRDELVSKIIDQICVTLK